MENCSICKREIVKPANSGGTGYGIDGARNKVCYQCCADQDREYMLSHGRITLYLSDNKVTNWPGSLEFKVKCSWQTGHNWWGVKQTFVRFIGPDGKVWSGRNVGDNDLLHCKRTKLFSVYS